jgi:hypothetical protein
MQQQLFKPVFLEQFCKHKRTVTSDEKKKNTNVPEVYNARLDEKLSAKKMKRFARTKLITNICKNEK